MKGINEREFWVLVWAVIGTVAIVLFAVVALYYYLMQSKLIENGYCENLRPGSAHSYWIKCDN